MGRAGATTAAAARRIAAKGRRLLRLYKQKRIAQA